MLVLALVSPGKRKQAGNGLSRCPAQGSKKFVGLKKASAIVSVFYEKGRLKMENQLFCSLATKS